MRYKLSAWQEGRALLPTAPRTSGAGEEETALAPRSSSVAEIEYILNYDQQND